MSIFFCRVGNNIQGSNIGASVCTVPTLWFISSVEGLGKYKADKIV